MKDRVLIKRSQWVWSYLYSISSTLQVAPTERCYVNCVIDCTRCYVNCVTLLLLHSTIRYSIRLSQPLHRRCSFSLSVCHTALAFLPFFGFFLLLMREELLTFRPRPTSNGEGLVGVHWSAPLGWDIVGSLGACWISSRSLAIYNSRLAIWSKIALTSPSIPPIIPWFWKLFHRS